MKKSTVSLFVTGLFVTAVLQLLVPMQSVAREVEAYYTVQIGTYISEETAEKNYQKIFARLHEKELQHLRIEKIKKYYVVRIGRFATKDDADRFFAVVSSKMTEKPLVTKTKVGPEVVIREYGAEPVPKPVSEKKSGQAAAAVQPPAKKEVARQKAAPPEPAEPENLEPLPVPVVKKERKPAPPVVKTQVEVTPSVTGSLRTSRKCCANPVLVLADSSGSMLDNTKITPKGAGDDSAPAEPLKKIEAEKQLLLNLSPRLSSSLCDFGVYRFMFRPGKQMLYDSLLRISAYDLQQAEQAIKKYFKTDYQATIRRSPLTDLLQQLELDIFWKLSGKITLLIITDGVVTNSSLNNGISAGMENGNTAEDELIAAVRRLRNKYGQSLVLHVVHAEETHGDANKSFLKSVATAGGGNYFTGWELLQDDRLLEYFSEILCCPEK